MIQQQGVMIPDQQNIAKAVGENFRFGPVRAMVDSVDRVLQALEAKGVAVESDGVRLIKKRLR
jgi:hypothetical protein